MTVDLDPVLAAIHLVAEQLRALPDDELVGLAMKAAAAGVVERDVTPPKVRRTKPPKPTKPAKKPREKEAATSSPGPTRGGKKGPLEGNILALLAKGPHSTQELVEATGALHPSVKSVIYRLRHESKIKKQANRGGAWSLT